MVDDALLQVHVLYLATYNAPTLTSTCTCEDWNQVWTSRTAPQQQNEHFSRLERQKKFFSRTGDGRFYEFSEASIPCGTFPENNFAFTRMPCRGGRALGPGEAGSRARRFVLFRGI
jgi:hypothetical protein